MEFEFGKHFKDATNLLLMMDHDSGYVEGVETTSSSNESSKDIVLNVCAPVSQNFYLSEDALLEKPDISFDWTVNLPYDINPDDHEETRKLFFSPEIADGSVPSQGSEIVYSGLENGSESESSAEIVLQPSIIVQNEEHQHDLIEDTDEIKEDDILMTTASKSDISLEQVFESQISEKCGSLVCPHEKCLKNTDNNNELGNRTVQPINLTQDKEYLFKMSDCKLVKEKPLEDILPDCLTPSKETSVTNKFNNNHEKDTASQPPIPSTSFEDSKAKKKLTLVFSKVEQENIYSVKRKYPSITPEKQPLGPANCNISPDIFDDELVPMAQQTYFEVQRQDNSLGSFAQSQIIEKLCDKLDQKLLKRVAKGMSGVLPPPSLTVIHMTVSDILSKLEENKNCWFWNSSSEECSEPSAGGSFNSSGDSGNGFSKSLLITCDFDEAQKRDWPHILDVRNHGLHYNCGKTSEEIVDLCDKYQKRYVSAETQSTCTIFESYSATSPSKRKTLKPRWGGKSPGRRLSHLARRRITFSSSNLQGNSSSIVGSRARQILVDAKKIDLLNRRRSPRKSPRKTPRKTPKKTPSTSPKLKTRTPSSSAKKKLAMRFRKLTGEIEKSIPNSAEVASSVQRTLFKSPEKTVKSESSKLTKRALFQSPSRDSCSSLLNSSRLQSSGEKYQLRRALFASPSKGKKSPLKHAMRFGYEKKRKRSESDEVTHTSKFARSMSMDVRPVTSDANKSVARTRSEMNISLNKSQNELSDLHKKKLLWAVSGALQSQNITNTHPQWKVFASVLARVTKRFFTSQMTAMTGTRPDVGTSERMHRIARYHVISVVKGKSVDEIVADYLKNRATKMPQRPQGYVPPEAKNKVSSAIKENVLQDRVNTIESWEKRRLEQQNVKSGLSENKLKRIRKVIHFGDDV